MNKSQLRLILEDLVRNFADTEPDGTWYGYNTNLGNCEDCFLKAETKIKNLYE